MMSRGKIVLLSVLSLMFVVLMGVILLFLDIQPTLTGLWDEATAQAACNKVVTSFNSIDYHTCVVKVVTEMAGAKQK